MEYKNIHVKPETMERFRMVGNRNQTDDVVINQLVDLHNETIEDNTFERKLG